MGEKREDRMQFDGMECKTGTDREYKETGEGLPPEDLCRTNSEDSGKKETSSFTEGSGSLEEGPGRSEDGSSRYGIPHKERPAPIDTQGKMGIVPKEPFYRNAYERHGLIAVILVVIGIPALIFIAGNIAVSAGIVPARTRDIVTGVLFLAAAAVLMAEKRQ